MLGMVYKYACKATTRTRRGVDEDPAAGVVFSAREMEPASAA